LSSRKRESKQAGKESFPTSAEQIRNSRILCEKSGALAARISVPGRPLKFLIATSLAEEAPRIAELLQHGGYETEWVRAEKDIELPGALAPYAWDLLFPDYRRQLRAINTELREKVNQLERSNADLEQFAWAASHDLKEPLRTISNYTQLLVRRRPKGKNVSAGGEADREADPESAEFAQFILEGVERMGALIDALLAYSRAMHQPPDSNHFTDAFHAAEEAAQTLHAAFEETGATVEIDALPAVRAESAPLIQVFQNLLANAVKYRNSETAPRIRISAVASHGEVRFSVKDNGIGIEPRHYDRIFEVFRRLHGEEQEGLGIGLAICKRLVERYGGRIWLDSEPGVGSTFYFTLPAAQTSSDARVARATA
jgi:light-regulated signal transduction histidine kinase (bacteriophytochrome)